MKSFLRQLDEAFTNYEQPVNENHLGVSQSNYIELSDRDASLALEIYAEEHINTDTELDEQNVTGAIAGYSTPNAFRKKPKKLHMQPVLKNQ